jgi:hypothetical protein
MRRKVIQDFANVFCQRILQLPEGYDLASFVHYGAGTYALNILTGECAYDGKLIPKLRTCDEFKDWLLAQLEKQRIPPESIRRANLSIEVGISRVQVRESYGHQFASAHFSFNCDSEIKTDETSYESRLSGEQDWGFDWYYNQLYGSVLNLARSSPGVTDDSRA